MFNINFSDDWIRIADLQIGIDHSTNWASTTALQNLVIKRGVIEKSRHLCDHF